MKFRKGHRGFDDLTDEEADDCEMMAESEDPPEYVDESSSPMAARILEDLEDDMSVRNRKRKRKSK